MAERKISQMNWEAIKNIYLYVLINKNKIEYLGGDKYKLIIYYQSGQKCREVEYQNELIHGTSIGWRSNGQKHYESKYVNGERQ